MEIEMLNKYILDQLQKGGLNEDTALTLLTTINEQDEAQHEHQDEDIAIIGLSCRFPEADNEQEYWSNLKNGKSMIRDFPFTRKKDTDCFIPEGDSPEDFYGRGGYLEHIDQFDPAFFRISPREALLMDPHQRVFLEVAWETLENAGSAGKQIHGKKVGVFAGRDHSSDTIYKRLVHDSDFLAITGSTAGIMASRISYYLNLKGPSIVVDTACSSGLVALHMACQALKNKDCEMALAGGINLSLFPVSGDSMIESAESLVRTFDKNANGTVWGEGIGIVMLKPLKQALKDRDHIRAVIKSSAINNDGTSNGISAPNAEAQEDVIVTAWQRAGINPEDITYIETHGTGTKLGDPIEVRALSNAFRRYTSKSQFCGIGSVKPNIGHLVGASGMSSLIKLILSLENKQIPPTVNFESPNPFIDFCQSPLYVNSRLKEWKQPDKPLLAGVSSFGFSGTNCHVVLQEAPREAAAENDVKARVLTLSARDNNSLVQYVERFVKFIIGTDSLPLDNISYSASVGRPHFSNRLAILYTDWIDLRKKLIHVYIHGLTKEGRGIFTGTHHVTKNNRHLAEEGGITVRELDRLNRLSSEILDRAALAGGVDSSLLTSLCQLYIQGADVNWDRLYSQQCTKFPLPAYPLKKERYWVAPEGIGQRAEQRFNKAPFIKERIKSSESETIFRLDMETKASWVLNEHKWHERSMLPGTGYLEMALEAVNERWKGESFELRDVTFLSPYFVDAPGKKKLVAAIHSGPQDALTFAIESVDDGGVRTVHAKGAFRRGAEIPPDKKAVGILKQAFREEQQPINISSMGGPFVFGKHWHGNELMLQQTKDSLLLEVQAAGDVLRELGQFHLHPSLMDIGINFAGKLIDEGLYVPYSYKKLVAYAPIPSRFLSYIRRKEGSPSRMALFDITFLDTDGNVILEVTDYGMRRLQNHESGFIQEREQQKLHRISWKKKEEAPRESAPRLGVTVIMKDRQGISEELITQFTGHGFPVIHVERGPVYQKTDEEHYTISSSEDDFQRLFQDLKRNQINSILYLFSLNTGQEPDTLDELEDAQADGIDSLFFCAKAIAQHLHAQPIHVTVITKYAFSVTGNERTVIPINATMAGFGKVIQKEYANLTVKCIDLDDETSVPSLVTEIGRTPSSYLTAMRNDLAYEEEIAEIEVMEHSSSIKVKKDGVYLITGGTGGIGLEVALEMARSGPVSLAFVSRTAIPSKEEWAGILAAGIDSKLMSIIRKLREIESLGARIVFYAGDVSHYESMREIVGRVRQEFHRINAVIHAAGVPGEGVIGRKDRNKLRAVLQPKVNGTWILHQLTKDDELDYFMMFSSVASLAGGAGQSDYTAANTYLDSFADYLRNCKKVPAISVKWTTWKFVGMAAGSALEHDQAIIHPIDPQEGVAAYKDILSLNEHQVMVGELNYPLLGSLDRIPYRFCENIESRLVNYRSLQADFQEQARPLEKLELKGRANGVYSPLETRIGQIWGEVLGLKTINVFDDFYELGGDSIQAIKISNVLNKEYGIDIDMGDLFIYTTIGELEGHVKDKLNQASLAGEPETALVNIDYELSHAQERMWFLQKLHPGLTAYNLPSSFRLEMEVNTELVCNAVDRLLARHETLRTIFVEDADGSPRQQIVDHCHADIKVIDLADDADKEETLLAMINADKRMPFDLRKPLHRFILFRLNRQDWCFYVNLHHLITDGWSSKIFFEELMTMYKALAQDTVPDLSMPAMRYVDWMMRQKSWFESEQARSMESYWLGELVKPLPALNLPADYSRPSIQTFNGGSHTFRLDEKLTQSVKSKLREWGTSQHVFFLSVYFLLLHSVTGDEDIIVGFPIAGRDSEEVENLIGLFINTLCIRAQFRNLETFQDVLNVVREKSVLAFKNGRYPFDLMVKKVNPERDLTTSPIYSTMFQFYEHAQVSDDTSLIDLYLSCREVEGMTEIRFEYNSDLYSPSTIERLSRFYEKMIDTVVVRSVKLEEMELLTLDDREIYMNRFNATGAPYPSHSNIVELFEQQAEREPFKAAVSEDKLTVTYSELQRRVTHLASRLVTEGVKRGAIVGMMTEHSAETIIGLLAVMKAGGAFLPIDPEYPAERVDYMLADSQVCLLLTNTDMKEDTAFEGKIIDLRLIGEPETEATPVFARIAADQLAYVIYTSGSTGRPKGVMVEHQGLLNYIWWAQKMYANEGDAVFPLYSSLAFDLTLTSIFTPLICGGTIEVYRNDGNEFLLYKVMKDNRATVVKLTPSHLMLLTDVDIGNTSVRRFIVGGEDLKTSLARSIVNKFQHRIEIYNEYGPTETVVGCMIHRYDETEDTGRSVPIGKPADNVRIYILNQHRVPCGVGVMGEIYIAGDGVAKGYINDREKSDEYFVPDPFIPNGRMYKSGDLGRFNARGQIEYGGRKDKQVKVRGYRIELGEVEAKLGGIEGIHEAVVLVQQGKDEVHQLRAYLIGDNRMSREELQTALAGVLPQYMIPASFTYVDELPLNANGKIAADVLFALEEPLRLENQSGPADDGLTAEITLIWQEILQLDRIDPRESFFNVGGDSISLVRLHNRLEKVFPQQVKLVDLFNYTTISALADYIGKKGEGGTLKTVLNQTVIQNEIDQMLDSIDSDDFDVEQMLQDLKGIGGD
ncbi:amino acid adenylation domain-containing protein [Paenibacillus sp. FSL P2-0089]|uniref:amino acid adenylation domain-containing protein n=1 Tax=unclassified Paenibacillus TaxID=185978 RepID=UPI0030F9EC8F